jgi:hypothetical protein
MSRLRNRIARRRAQPGEEATADALAPHEATADAPAPGESSAQALAPDEPRMRGVAERGRARRRLRYLGQLRELQLRDLGGFVLDLYRFGEQRDRLVRQKLDRVIDTDKETHALEALLGAGGAGRGRAYEIRMPGVGGTCPGCGDFHASNARFCAQCGINLSAATAPIRAGHAPAPPSEELAPSSDEQPAQAADESSPAAGEETAAHAAPVPEPRTPRGGVVDGDWPEADAEGGEDEPVQLAAVRERQRRASP